MLPWLARAIKNAPYLTIAIIAASVYAGLVILDASLAIEQLRSSLNTRLFDEILLLSNVLTFALAVSLIVESRQIKAEIALRRDAELKSELISQTDPLTGLANRRCVGLEAPKLQAEARENGRVLAALLVGLDRLKPVNDTLGHAAGDAMIRTVADRIKVGARANALVARIGGDEFAVVFACPRDGADEAADATAHQLLARIAKPLTFSDTQQIEISASIGVAIAEPDASLEDLLRRADQAMYCAKSNGRNQVAHFDAAMGDLMRQRAALERDMRRALKQGEFVPYFHPLVDLSSRKICGFEVLARWNHPERGLVGPVEFVPIAEETGMIGELSESILRQACLQAVGWEGDMTLAFNLSPVQFREKDLANRISQVLEETGFPPHRLEIELTENAVILDIEAAQETMAALKKTGARIALDDFGTGYSSLSNLRQLPFDKVKIDRSFVTDASSDQDNAKIVEGILGLTRSLGLVTTAEGIESSDDEAWLRSLGCEQGQGFLFSRPMPADEVAMRLDAMADQQAAATDAPAASLAKS